MLTITVTMSLIIVYNRIVAKNIERRNSIDDATTLIDIEKRGRGDQKKKSKKN